MGEMRDVTVGRRSFVRGSLAYGAAGLAALVGAPLTGCASAYSEPDTPASATVAATTTTSPISGDAPTLSEETTSTPESRLEADVEQLLGTLSLYDKVCQLFCIRPEALTGVSPVTAAGDTTRACLEATPVGGIIYFSQNIVDEAQLRALLADTTAMPVPVVPFLAVDEEGGPLVARVANSGIMDVPTFPAMSEIGATGDPAQALEVGDAIGTYLADLGFTLDFAPDADVLTNPESSIGTRSFSSDPQVAAEMVAQVVAGLQAHGVSAAAKHFPGHGDAAADSHTGAAVSDRTLDDLRSCEFLPFSAAIGQSVDFVMVGHISTPNAAADGLPASLSPTAITDWLRGELGFEGIVVSDSLAMGAVTDYYASDEAAVAFLQAGGDLVLDPEDFALALQGVLDATAQGTLTEDRIDESVRRILRAKLRKAGDYTA